MSSKGPTRQGDRETAPKRRPMLPILPEASRIPHPDPRGSFSDQAGQAAPTLTSHGMLHLQRTVGNQGVGRLLGRMRQSYASTPVRIGPVSYCGD